MISPEQVVMALLAGFVSGATVAVVQFLLLRLSERREEESSFDRWYDDEHGEPPSVEGQQGPPDDDDELQVQAELGDDLEQPGRFARLRERFRSHDIEDATDDEAEVGGWKPKHRNVVLGDDGELHPIDEAAQEQEQEDRDG